ncbi:hypothetical protein VTI28DRAFT_10141 [Corynascus sepedonium]
MAHLVRSLVEWQEYFPSVVLEDEKDDTISGYTTFINQLDERLRESADVYAMERWMSRFDEKRTQAAETRLKKSSSYKQSAALKAQVASDLQGRPKLEIWQRRARMLLQSAGWLDIDKLVEYREPPEDVGLRLNIWNKPRAPQLTMSDRARPLENLKSTVEDDIDGGVPLPVRKFLEGFPLGNSHLSLMIGPLIIENGVKLNLPSARSGALVTCREPPHLQTPIEADANPTRSIAVSEQRSIFTQLRPFQERRLKACMKQVVSGAFSGFLDESREVRIANLLVNEAQTYSELETKFPTRTRAWFERKLEQAAERLVVEAQPLLEPRIRYYLDLVATRLMDPDFPLHWDFMDNNCQKFCDGLLSYNVFGRVFDPYDDSGRAGNEELTPRPLYLISFVCRPESYTKQYARTKYDVPNGLTEEYLLKFRYGRHDHADIFDTLQEYWYDLGNFRGPLYKHQELFPWDCTEAYCKEPIKCNDCSLSKHVWAFPFDSWSLIHLHLQKDRRWYPPRDVNKLRLTDREWMDNRLQLMLAQDVLIQGAISIQKHLKHSCGWLAQSAKFDRLRLGGIHRAQPLSHHYERGRFQEAYVTPWVHLKREDQIRIYESIRDRRTELTDIDRILAGT